MYYCASRNIKSTILMVLTITIKILQFKNTLKAHLKFNDQSKLCVYMLSKIHKNSHYD